MAIGRKTGGRQRGTPNKATATKVAEIAASGLTPLDYLLGVMRDDDASVDVRLDAAKAAAPYVHPRLGALTVGGDAEAPLQTITRIELVPMAPRYADGSPVEPGADEAR